MNGKIEKLIEAIRILKEKKITYDCIVNNQEGERMELDLIGFSGSDNAFFESVKKAMKFI